MAEKANQAEFHKTGEELKAHEASLLIMVVTLLKAVLIVAFGVWPSPAINFAEA
jgi:hypothetical protein